MYLQKGRAITIEVKTTAISTVAFHVNIPPNSDLSLLSAADSIMPESVPDGQTYLQKNGMNL